MIKKMMPLFKKNRFILGFLVLMMTGCHSPRAFTDSVDGYVGYQVIDVSPTRQHMQFSYTEKNEVSIGHIKIRALNACADELNISKRQLYVKFIKSELLNLPVKSSILPSNTPSIGETNRAIPKKAVLRKDYFECSLIIT